MWDIIYHVSLDSSATCKYELKLKKMSAKEIWCLQKNKISLEISFKYLIKMH